MLNATNLELVVAGRQLLKTVTFQVGAGDRVGLVGRNGAGKTTLARVLASEALPTRGRVRCSGAVAYLPQDPRTGDLDEKAIDRVLGARGLDRVARQLEQARRAMSGGDGSQEQAMRSYSRLEERFHLLGGWKAEAEAASIASRLGLPERVLEQPLGTLSGGQRRRVELSRVLFSEAPTLVLDEPTNHLDSDSISWLKGYLKGHEGGLIVISHDAALLETVVNRGCFILTPRDANSTSTGSDGIDAAIDTVGTDEAIDVSGALVPDRARIVTAVAFGRALELGIKAIGYGPGADPGTEFRSAARLELVRQAGEGQLRVIVARTYSLDDVADAHRELSDGHTHGKIILVP